MAHPLENLKGKYEILEKLGEGGKGAVYQVRHRFLDELRVVKMLRSALKGDKELEERFVREARVATRLRHPNIAQLYDFSLDDEGNAYMVLEFIEGLTLEDLLKQHGPPSLGLVLEIGCQALKSIGYLHRCQVVHRDISPDNLMLSRDVDGRPLVKLIDLGIAKALEAPHWASLTRAGTRVGKLKYASRVELDARELDGRSDLYAFGVVLYELLSGCSPIEGSRPEALIAGHLMRPPRSFEETDLTGRVPAALRKIVLQALEKKRQDRFPNAEAFCNRLAKLQSQYPLTDRGIEAAFATLSPAPGRKSPGSRPGSTQERLDRQFQPGTTPSHGEELLTGPALKRQTQRERDRQVEQVLEWDPENDRTQLLRQPLRTPSHQRLELQWRKRRIEQTAHEIDALLERGELPAAERLLVAAVAQLGPEETFGELRQRLAELKRLERIELLLAGAHQSRNQGDYRRAVGTLEQALELASGHERVKTLLDRSRRDLKRQEIDRRRGEAAIEIEALLSANDLEGAARRLAEARAELGESEGLFRLRERLESIEQLAAAVTDIEPLPGTRWRQERELLAAAAEKVPCEPVLEGSDPLGNLASVIAATSGLRAESGRLSAQRIAASFGLSVAELAKLLGKSRQAVSKTADAESIQEGLAPFARIARLRAVLSDEDFRAWLHLPNELLDGHSPSTVIRDGKAGVVADLAEDMLSGSPT